MERSFLFGCSASASAFALKIVPIFRRLLGLLRLLLPLLLLAPLRRRNETVNAAARGGWGSGGGRSAKQNKNNEAKFSLSCCRVVILCLIYNIRLRRVELIARHFELLTIVKDACKLAAAGRGNQM